MLPSDDLHDFTRRSIVLQKQTKTVFTRGSGPAVIVVQKLESAVNERLFTEIAVPRHQGIRMDTTADSP